MVGHHDDSCVFAALADKPDCVESGESWHRDVQEDHVGLERAQMLKGRAGISAFADDHEFRHETEPAPEGRSEHRLIVYQVDCDSLCRAGRTRGAAFHAGIIRTGAKPQRPGYGLLRRSGTAAIVDNDDMSCQAAHPPRESSQAPGTALKPSIVLADDDRNLRMLVKTMLENSDFEIVEASHGREAVTVTRERLPVLVLLDWMMPQMTGIEVVKRLREDPSTVHIPIVMLTARGDDGDRRLAESLGVAAYVTKPFSPLSLFEIMASAIERSSQHRGAGCSVA
jgi:CheY-like chemotaxis protein